MAQPAQAQPVLQSYYLKLGSSEFRLFSRSSPQPESSHSKWVSNNIDIISLIFTALCATLAILYAYGYLSSPKPMFIAGMLTGGATIMLMFTIWTFFLKHLTIKDDVSAVSQSPS